jgi:hypothetical protein
MDLSAPYGVQDREQEPDQFPDWNLRLATKTNRRVGCYEQQLLGR